jgi:hypothetical protein
MSHARNPPPSVQEKPVTTDTRPFEEMNTIAKQITEQALVATDDYFKFLKKTISSHPARGSDVGTVLKSNAEKNIDLVQEFVHKLSDAKDFQDLSSKRVHAGPIHCNRGANKKP